MFELTLSINLEKQQYLLDFKKKLLAELGEDFATIISHNDDGRCFVAIACDDLKKAYLKAKIVSGILDIIVSAYKFEFFKSAFSPLPESIIILPFLKAISIFDKDSDFEVIKSEINVSNEILIDSFFSFRLQGLKTRWQKTAGIIKHNNIISSDEAMIEVIKYLSLSSENYSLIANVSISESGLEIKNYSGKQRFSSENSGVSKFLTEIIALNPLKINVIRDFELDKENKVYNILSDIFGEKIYLQS